MSDQIAGLICSSCGEFKTTERLQKRTYLTKNGEAKSCYLSECKDCCNTRGRANNPNTKEKRKETRARYYRNNKERVRAQGDRYYQENRESVLASQKEYQSTNKNKVRVSKNKSEQKRMKSDPTFRMRRRVSSHVRDHLKRFGADKKGGSVLDFLPYSIGTLRIHLESQFESWMSWDNYGPYSSKTWDDNDRSTWTWSIDHIVPQHKLPYTSMDEENFQKCWALANLRPLSAKQNLLDGVNKAR